MPNNDLKELGVIVILVATLLVVGWQWIQAHLDLASERQRRLDAEATVEVLRLEKAETPFTRRGAA